MEWTVNHRGQRLFFYRWTEKQHCVLVQCKDKHETSSERWACSFWNISCMQQNHCDDNVQNMWLMAGAGRRAACRIHTHTDYVSGRTERENQRDKCICIVCRTTHKYYMWQQYMPKTFLSLRKLLISRYEIAETFTLNCE